MKKNLIVVGPALSISRCGERTRFAISSLRKSNKYNLYLHNTNSPESTWLSHNAPHRAYIDSLIEKTNKLNEKFEADISLQVCMPHEFKVYSKINIGYTSGSPTNRVDEDWIVASNMMNGIIVPSEHSKSTFMHTSGYKAKMNEAPRVVALPDSLMNISDINEESVLKIKNNLKMLKDMEYNFLTVAQTTARENVFNLVKWFLGKFSGNENISLTLNIHSKNFSTVDKFNTVEKISNFINQLYPKKKCKVNILHGSLTREETSYLYRSGIFTHYLCASYGDTDARPVFDAASSGLVVLSPLWSSQKDFLKKDSIISIPYEVKEVQSSAIWEGIICKGSQWAFPDSDGFVDCLTDSIENYQVYKKKAKILARQIVKKYTTQKQSFMFNQIVEEVAKKERRFINAQRRN